MHLSLMPVTISDASPIEVVEAALAAGYDSCGLTLWGFAGGASTTLADPAALRALRARVREAGLPVLAVEAVGLAPDFSLAALEPLLDATADLACPYLNVCGDDPDEARMTDNLAALATLAATRGVRIALEFISRLNLRSLPQARAMIERAGVPGIELVVDSLHLYRSGGRAADLEGLPASLLAYAQLCDAPLLRPPEAEYVTEGRTNRLYPGEGGLPLGEFLDALPPGRPLGVEVPNLAGNRHASMVRAQLAMEKTRRYLASRVPGS